MLVGVATRLLGWLSLLVVVLSVLVKVGFSVKVVLQPCIQAALWHRVMVYFVQTFSQTPSFLIVLTSQVLVPVMSTCYMFCVIYSFASNIGLLFIVSLVCVVFMVLELFLF